MLVAGEAGVGKTRLLEELAMWARGRGHRVLIGGCISLSAEVAPFAPMIEALRLLTRDLPEAELSGVLGPSARGLAPLISDPALISEAAPVDATTSSMGISPDTAVTSQRSGGSFGRVEEMVDNMVDATPSVRPTARLQSPDHRRQHSDRTGGDREEQGTPGG